MQLRLLRRQLLAVTAAIALAFAGLALAVAHPSPAHAATTFNVKNYGATGNGSSNDTSAINKAIAAASAASGGGIVDFPSGTYKSANTIHMMSNVTLNLESGATIMGASGTGYDKAESNSNDQYQDYGHSHFHDAMIYGDRLTNIGFTGSGTIDGGDHLITGNPDSGQADKIISLTRCSNLTLSGITLRRGGHFAALINGCDGVTSDHLTIDTGSDRDGWNIINTQNATITNINDTSNDDALVFKSDWALGQRFPQGHVRVTNAHLKAGCCNALMFGSETCSDFHDYVFDTITITGADKSGLGLVSMDGANIYDVHYRNITMSGVASPIMQKIGTRKRCGDNPGVGSIHDITYENVTGTGKSSPQYSPTLWGADSTHQPSNISFDNVNITVPGGHSSMSTGVPSNDASDYNPKSIGTRPAYGWYIHNANHVTFTGSSVKTQSSDARPAFIANSANAVSFDHLTASRSSGSQDGIWQTVSGYCLSNSANTSGDPLRISATGSSEDCGGTTPPPANRYEAENGNCQGTIDSNHTGFSGTGFCNTTNAVGSTETWTVNRDAAGSATLAIRYGNGTTTNRPATVSVNGGAPVTVDFPGTGSWDTWATATVPATLNAGANTVTVTSTTADGTANLDYLDVS
jgi:Glycosyl hydrolases family 28/Carbohydrate binding module (family 35)